MKKFLLAIIAITVFAGALRSQTYLYEDFTGSTFPAGWQNIDADGDNNKWVLGGNYVLSFSYYNGSALHPNNWLITPQIDLTNATAGTDLLYYVATYTEEYPAEHYQVRLSTGTAATAEFTNVLYDETLTASNTSFKQRVISLDDYIGEKVYIAFVHNNCSDNYAIAIAEPKVIGANEISIYSISVPEFVTLNDSILVSGYVINLGSAPMTSFSVSYSVDGGAETAEETFSGLNVARDDTAYFYHSKKIAASDVETMNLKIIIRNNDNENDTQDNNEAEVSIVVYDKHTKRHVMIEQFTTANCNKCPAATQKLKNLLNGRTDFTWVAHHQGYGTDNLTHASANQLIAFYNDGGNVYAPGCMLDRTVVEEGSHSPVFLTSDISKELLDRMAAVPAFVTVNITDATFDQAESKLTVTVEGELLRDIEPDANDLRLGLYLKEDNLKTTPGQSGSTLGTNYIHNNVMRANISGVWGDNGVITSNKAGTTYSRTFTYTVPTTYTYANCSLIAFVAKYNANVLKRQILNSKGVSFTEITSGNLPANDIVYNANGENVNEGIGETNSSIFSISPNPATNNITLTSDAEIRKVEIINLAGQLVKTIEGNISTISISELCNGLYFVKCETSKGTSVKKFVKE